MSSLKKTATCRCRCLTQVLDSLDPHRRVHVEHLLHRVALHRLLLHAHPEGLQFAVLRAEVWTTRTSRQTTTLVCHVYSPAECISSTGFWSSDEVSAPACHAPAVSRCLRLYLYTSTRPPFFLFSSGVQRAAVHMIGVCSFRGTSIEPEYI